MFRREREENVEMFKTHFYPTANPATSVTIQHCHDLVPTCILYLTIISWIFIIITIFIILIGCTAIILKFTVIFFHVQCIFVSRNNARSLSDIWFRYTLVQALSRTNEILGMHNMAPLGCTVEWSEPSDLFVPLSVLKLSFFNAFDNWADISHLKEKLPANYSSRLVYSAEKRQRHHDKECHWQL